MFHIQTIVILTILIISYSIRAGAIESNYAEDINAQNTINQQPEINQSGTNSLVQAAGLNNPWSLEDAIYPFLKPNYPKLNASQEIQVNPYPSFEVNHMVQHHTGDDDKSLHKEKKWPEDINIELAKTWYECNPKKLGHAQRMYNRWRQVQPRYANITQSKLNGRARRLIAKIERRDYTGVRRDNHVCWTKELEGELVAVWKQYHSKKPGFRGEFHKAWLKLHPEMAGINERKIQDRLYRILKRNPKEETTNIGGRQHMVEDIPNESSKKGIKWPSHINNDLKMVWYASSPGEGGHSQRVYDLWSDLHPDYINIGKRNLIARARHLVKKRELSEQEVNQGPKHVKRIRWTKELDEDLLRIAKRDVLKGYGWLREIHRLFMKEHPQLSFITRRSVKDHLEILMRKSSYSNSVGAKKDIREHDVSSISNHQHVFHGGYSGSRYEIFPQLLLPEQHMSFENNPVQSYDGYQSLHHLDPSSSHYMQ